MRTLLVVATIALICVAGVFAGESDTESMAEVDVEVPTLPGLGSGCLPKYAKRNYRSASWKKQGKRRVVSFGGQCVAEASCPVAQQEHGYCAGIGAVCCRAESQPTTPAPIVAPIPNAMMPAVAPTPSAPIVLKAAASACATQNGACVDKSTCKGTTKSGLCPGASSIVCCFAAAAAAPSTPSTPAASTTSLSALVKIPAGINSGLTRAGASFLNSKIGSPGCPLTAACFSCTCAVSNAKINKNKVTLQITPTVKVTGIKPFVEAVARAMAAVKTAGASNPQLMSAYNGLKTAGGLCCRPIKKSNGTPGSSWSNHSWGTAVDFYFGANMDPRGDGKTQYGLALIAPYFLAEKLYWAAGYAGSEEDAMHFETSVESMNAWVNAKLI